MTGQQFYDLIMSRLGRRTAVELRNIVIQETEQAVQTLSRASWSPWFLFEEWEVNTSADVSTIDTTRDVANIDEEYPFLRWIPSDEYGTAPEQWRLLTRKPAWQIQRTTVPSGSDIEPEFWNRAQGATTFQIELFPTPTMAGVLKLQAYTMASTPPDSADDTNPWLVHAARWLMADVAATVAMAHLQNPQLSQMFQVEEQRERESHWRKSQAMLHAQIDYSRDED